MQPNNREAILRARNSIPPSHAWLLPHGRDAKFPPRTHRDAIYVPVHGNLLQGFDSRFSLSGAYLCIIIIEWYANEVFGGVDVSM